MPNRRISAVAVCNCGGPAKRMPMLFSPTIGAAIKAGHRRAVGRRRTELCGRPDSGPTIDGSSAPTSTVATDVMHAIAKDRMIDAVLHDDAPPATVGGKTLLDDVIALAMTVKVIRRYFVNRSATRRGDCLVEDGSGPHKAVLPVRHGRDRPCCLSCCVARRRPRADFSVAAARRSWGRAETTVRWCRAHGNTAYVVFHGRRDVGVASTDVDVPASEATKASHPRSRGCNAGP
jgi:hypothetical protein